MLFESHIEIDFGATFCQSELTLSLLCSIFPANKTYLPYWLSVADDRGRNFRSFNYATVIVFNPKETRSVKET